MCCLIDVILEQEQEGETKQTSKQEKKQKKQKSIKPNELEPAWEDEADENLEIYVTQPNLKKLRKSYEEKKISGPEYSNRLRNK